MKLIKLLSFFDGKRGELWKRANCKLDEALIAGKEKAVP